MEGHPFVCKHCAEPFFDAELCKSASSSHARGCPRFASPRGAAEAEVELLRRALQQSEERVREERALREELERRKDAQICRLTLQLQPELPPVGVDGGGGGAISVEFEEEGGLGIVTDELETGSPGVFIVGIRAGGQAARHAALQPGMRIVGVAGRSCAGLRYREVTQMIRNHSARPLVLTLQAPPPSSAPPAVSTGYGEPEPEPEPEPECTAEISEGVPPPGLSPSSPPPLAALARRLSADAGRVVAGFKGWEQRPAVAAEGEPWVDVEKSLGTE